VPHIGLGGCLFPKFARFAPLGEPLGPITKPAPCSPLGMFPNRSLLPPPPSTSKNTTIVFANTDHCQVPLSFLGFAPRPHLGGLAPLDPHCVSMLMMLLAVKATAIRCSPTPRTSQPASCSPHPHQNYSLLPLPLASFCSKAAGRYPLPATKTRCPLLAKRIEEETVFWEDTPYQKCGPCLFCHSQDCGLL